MTIEYTHKLSGHRRQRLGYGFLVAVLIAHLTIHLNQVVIADNEAPPASPIPAPPPSTTSPSPRQTTTKIPNDSSTSKTEVSKSTSKPKDINLECPAVCECSQKEISCDNARLKSIPNLSKFNSVTDISLKYNLIEKIDFSLLPVANLEQLDLSGNKIRSFPQPKKKEVPELPKLVKLNLAGNEIENLEKFGGYKLPALQTLDLSHNDIQDLDRFAFNRTTNLKDLNLAGNSYIKSIHEEVFWPLTQLTSLNMSEGCLKSINHLGDKQFVKNQRLKIVDLTENQLVEVPFALRGTDSIEKLILTDNSMTSLRPSDFINSTSLSHLEVMRCKFLTKIDDYTFSNMPELKTLIIAYNPSLNHISKDAFKSNIQVNLKLFDLRGNNLTALSNPKDFPSLTFESVWLQENPWDCNCQMRWVQAIPDTQRSPVHCKTPYRYKDMEISQFFSTTDCDVVESDYHTIIVTGFILFILGLFIAILIQRNDRLRRLFWKDQYGTIYYTKASFPPEGTV